MAEILQFRERGFFGRWLHQFDRVGDADDVGGGDHPWGIFESASERRVYLRGAFIQSWGVGVAAASIALMVPADNWNNPDWGVPTWLIRVAVFLPAGLGGTLAVAAIRDIVHAAKFPQHR